MGNVLENMASAYSTVVVTGGSSGIGQAFIRQLHSLNGTLRVCNLSRRKPDVNIDGLDLRHHPCDLADREALDVVVERLLADLAPGPVLLINNSGFGSCGPFPEPGLDRHLAMIDVNVRAPVALTGLLLPRLRESGGAVVNIASTAAFQPTPYLATYGAGKAFLLNWSLALERELAGIGVHVLAVCPGPTATGFFRAAGFESRVVSPLFSQSAEAVVTTSLKALAKRRALCVSGWKNRLVVAAGSVPPRTWVARVSEWVLRRVRLDPSRRDGK